MWGGAGMGCKGVCVLTFALSHTCAQVNHKRVPNIQVERRVNQPGETAG